MLHELRVENLLLLKRAELRLAPGLNVLTGETGAGKTMLAQALDLLLGGRAGPRIVRGGAQEAYVEGVFTLPAGLDEALRERLPGGTDELVLARRVWADGRTRAYVCGRAATVSDLRELGGRLLAFYGQHEHRKLMMSASQLDIVDAHCGFEQLARRERCGTAHALVRSLESRVEELRELASARERELDLLAFELGEIEAAAPSEEEHEALTHERDRLRHLEALRTAAALGAEALSSDAGGGAGELIAEAVPRFDALSGIDPDLDALGARLEALRLEADELGGELRRYALDIEGSPGRLEEVEERLALLSRLERKHGGSTATVLAHAERCRERIAELQGAEVALEGADAELAAAQEQLERLAGELRAARTAQAPRLATAVRERLAELAMPDAKLEIELRPHPDGCGPRGADLVELMIAPNAGVPAGALREIASGGELSRVMLAVLSAAHGVGGGDDAPLLVFDEIDAGIGGHTARAVGEHLRGLAEGRQILCITHLPQVASLAERHFRIEKHHDGGRTETTVCELTGDGVVGELVRMLGAAEGDRAASQHARRLLRAA